MDGYRGIWYDGLCCLPDIPLLIPVCYVGGARIITAVLQVFLNVLLGDDMYTATSRPRMHHQLVPPGVVFYSRLHSTHDKMISHRPLSGVL